MNAPEEVKAQWAARSNQEREAEEFEVLPENWPAAELFLVCATQWRVAGMSGIPIGLDYAGVRAALAMMRRRPTPELFDDLREMEIAAINAFAEDRK